MRVLQDEQPQMREKILAGICPFCGKSGLKVVAAHTRISHGINSRQLRDLAGFTYTESICDPEVSAARSEISKDQRPCDYGTPDYSQREYSIEGRKRRDAQLRPAPEILTREELSAAGQKGGRAAATANLKRRGKIG